MDVEGKVFGCVKRNCKWSCQIFNLLDHRNNFDWKNFWKKVNFYIDLYIWQKIFISCQNYFNQVVKTAFYVTQKNNLLRNKFIGNIIFLFSFRHWWKFFGFASASFRWSSQNSNQSVQGNVLKKVIFSQNSNFFIFFGFSTRKFPRFSEDFMRAPLFCILRDQKSFLRKFFQRHTKFSTVLYAVQKNSAIFQKVLGRAVKFVLPVSIRIARVKIVLFKKTIFYWNWAKFFRLCR